MFGGRAVAQEDAEGDRRMLPPVDGYLLRQEEGQHGLAAGDGNMAPPDAREIGDLAFDPFHVAELAPDMVDQDFTGRRQPHPAGEAFEDRHAQFLLDGDDAPVQRGGGNRQVFRGLADRSMPRDGIDIGERRELAHGVQSPEWCV